ncbi:DUF3164 family protein [Myroides odoratimimus]|uniref:DUF3164 family protein n=1 Tax=Myroides odoratimimus TaxID=76832 RepID=UPI002576E457|nr:DUF3164 family protein [Myroides odoratimimus]MDM1093397.1 DUF3164 family protein [Myroides odoratimimus]
MEALTLSTADLRAELEKREAKEREVKEQSRIAYESMKEDVVMSLVHIAEAESQKLKDFKSHAFESMNALYALLLEYSERRTGKGNFQVEYGDCKVEYRRQGIASFDEKADQAEQHIIDFVTKRFENDQDTKDLIMSLLERKNGQLDVLLIQKLYTMESRFDDENWRKGIELLKESYQYNHSKDYIRFFKRNENGEWKSINLNFASLPYAG